jgi:hypothetical protein
MKCLEVGGSLLCKFGVGKPELTFPLQVTNPVPVVIYTAENRLVKQAEEQIHHALHPFRHTIITQVVNVDQSHSIVDKHVISLPTAKIGNQYLRGSFADRDIASSIHRAIY